jgi:acetyltransferase
MVSTMSTNQNPPLRPYPIEYVSEWTMRDGTPVIIRPIRPDDVPLMVKFHSRLSDRTVYMRYFSSLSLARRTGHERLAHICSCDYVSEMVLVAEGKDPDSGERSILAVGRLNKLGQDKNQTAGEAEAALLVADAQQRLGLGTELLRRLVVVARNEGIHRIVAEMLRDNVAVQALFKKFGFRLCSIDGGFNEVEGVLDL